MYFGFFSFSGGEIILVVLAALILFGSKKMPDFARTLGKGMNEFRKATDELKREFKEGTQDIADDIKQSKKDLQHEISDIKSSINESIDTQDNIKSANEVHLPKDTMSRPSKRKSKTIDHISSEEKEDTAIE